MPRRALPSGAGRARGRVLHPGRVEGRSPEAFVVPRELEIVALARHADCDPPDAGPGVEPGPQRPERTVIRRPWKAGEAECRSQKLAALVEHALFDHVVRPPQHRRRNRQAQSLGGLEIDHQLELRRLLYWEVIGLCTL
jgi:hypothetical protein